MYEIQLGEREYDYYPDWKDNLKRKELKARLRLITTSELESAIDYVSGTVNRRAIVEKGLIELSGLKVDDKEIKTTEDILDTPGLFSLYVDIFAEINSQSRLTEEESKN